MNDCQDLDLFLFPFYAGVSHPFSGTRRSVTFYGARVEVDGKVYNAIVEPVTERERLVGRDVLNQMKVTFDRPSRYNHRLGILRRSFLNLRATRPRSF